MVAHTCHPSYVGSVNRRIMVQGSLGINTRTYSKNIYSKKSAEGIENARSLVKISVLHKKEKEEIKTF
jgi:hypothetical protein